MDYDSVWAGERRGELPPAPISSGKWNHSSMWNVGRKGRSVTKSANLHAQKPGVGAKGKGKKVLVPAVDGNRPLYHPISRAVLEPGTELPIIPMDETWYIHKHREAIRDYTDLNPWETRYLFAWDAHILPQRILSSVYLPRAWLGFVEKNAEWLVSDNLLMEELGKHLCNLRGCGLLEDDAIVRTGVGILDAARRRLESEKSENEGSAEATPSGENGPVADAGGPSTSSNGGSDNRGATRADAAVDGPYPLLPSPRSVGGCGVCFKPVRGPSLMVCSNEVRFIP